ncbi:MAG: head decoration protein [Dehalococcoidia bacterium]
MSSPSFGSTPYSPDRLLAGDFPIVTREVTLNNVGGAALTRGAVLGKVTADGKYGLSLSAAVDGSQVARAILAKDADPTGGDVTATIYEAGEFNEDQLNFGTGHTAATVREDLRAVSLFLKSPVSA